ncbi:MAG: hypothetical protein Q9217_005289 [Psora testacea]
MNSPAVPSTQHSPYFVAHFTNVQSAIDESEDDSEEDSEVDFAITMVEGCATSATSFSSDESNSSYIFRFANNRPQFSRVDKVKEVAVRMTLLFLGYACQVIYSQGSRDHSPLPSHPASCSTSYACGSTKSALDEKDSIRQPRNRLVQHPGLEALSEGSRSMSWIAHPQNTGEATIDDPIRNVKDFFDSKAEREEALWINRRKAGAEDLLFPDFFRHGIQYTPTEDDDDWLRTVLVSGLPADTRMIHVLEKVRGGVILDAKLLDTLSITNNSTNTALVTFLHGDAAKQYHTFANEHPITIRGAIAQVSIVATPTWPTTINIHKAVNDYGHTRCFEVSGFSPDINPVAVRQDLNFSRVMKIGGLESMRFWEGVLGLRFSSIRYASQATKMFQTFRRYRGCTVRWLPDPCAQPLETLLQHSKLPACTIVDTINQALPCTERVSGGVTDIEPGGKAYSSKACYFRANHETADPITSSLDVVSSVASSFCTIS